MRILSVLMIMVMGLSTVALGQSADGDLPNVKKILNNQNVSKMTGGLFDVFPQGTSRDLVHKALTNAGAEYGGKAENHFNESYATNIHYYDYQKPWYLRWLHNGSYRLAFFFDDENRLLPHKIPSENAYTSREWTMSISVSGPGAL